jgi:hypothetical protein
MIVSMLEASNEVDRLGRSSVEVALSKPVMLLGMSFTADMLEIIASVVTGDGTIPLKIAVLEVIASISVLSTLVKTVEADSSSLISVDVGKTVADATSSEAEVIKTGSAVATSEPPRMLVVLPTTSVRLSLTIDDAVFAGRATSVGVVKASIVVLGVIVPASVGSSCVRGSEVTSEKLESEDRSILAADVIILSALSVTENEDGLNTLVASSEPKPTPRLMDTLAVGVTFVVSENVGDGGGT